MSLAKILRLLRLILVNPGPWDERGACGWRCGSGNMGRGFRDFDRVAISINKAMTHGTLLADLIGLLCMHGSDRRTIGVFLCLDYSSIRWRLLGVRLPFVRSLDLDDWILTSQQ